MNAVIYSPRELGVDEQLPVFVAASSSTKVLNEAAIDSLLLVALEQFEDQATNGLLLSLCIGGIWHNTKEDAKKTSAKMLPSTLNTHCL